MSNEDKENWKKKYEELLDKHQQAVKRMEALEKQLETAKLHKLIDIKYEEKSEIDKFLTEYLGDRPKFGGGATLRWSLFEDLIKYLHKEKDGDYAELVRRFARMKGLTERKVEYGYIKPLVDDGIIEVFYGNTGLKWRWKGKAKKMKGE